VRDQCNAAQVVVVTLQALDGRIDCGGIPVSHGVFGQDQVISRVGTLQNLHLILKRKFFERIFADRLQQAKAGFCRVLRLVCGCLGAQQGFIDQRGQP
jgi:hypothetical protein